VRIYRLTPVAWRPAGGDVLLHALARVYAVFFGAFEQQLQSVDKVKCDESIKVLVNRPEAVGSSKPLDRDRDNFPSHINSYDSAVVKRPLQWYCVSYIALCLKGISHLHPTLSHGRLWEREPQERRDIFLPCRQFDPRSSAACGRRYFRL
jgi:hypothetical protein